MGPIFVRGGADKNESKPKERQAPPEKRVKGFVDFGFIDLAGPFRAINEGDWHFANLETGLLTVESHFDEKAIATAKNGVQVNRL